LRTIAEAAYFSGYEDQMHYAMLSFKPKGPPSYGDATLVFKEEAIANRATVYEENSGVYPLKSESRVDQLLKMPEGKVATWEDRGKLCVTKHAEDITADVKTDEYQELLVQVGEDGEKDTFVEVHIYGKINRDAVKKIVFHLDKDEKVTSIHRLLCEVWRERLKGHTIDIEMAG
jgi:hypothetical protein